MRISSPAVPALLLTALGASCEDPIVWDFAMVNDGSDNVHLFLASDDSKGSSNKVEQGDTRYLTYKYDNADQVPDTVRIEAWRGETMMSSTTCPGAVADDKGWTVTFTEQNGAALACVED